MAFKVIKASGGKSADFDPKADAVRAYAEGKSLQAASAKARVSVGALRTALRKSGSPARDPGTAISLGKGGKRAKRTSEVVRRYQEGESTVSIAKDLGVAPQTVIDWLKSVGVELRSTAGARSNPDGKAAAMRLRREGKSFRAIAAALNVNPATVWKWLK